MLRSGTCVAASCGSVVPGLGVCLSELVATKSSDPSAPPMPSVSGINTPTVVKKRLEWWQILLMALGCAFIFVVILWCCRRRQRKKRAEKTELFAVGAIRNRGQTSWRWRLIKFIQDLSGRGRKRVVVRPGIKIVHLGLREQEDLALQELRAAEEARAFESARSIKSKPSTTQTTGEEDMVRLIGSYNQPSAYERTHHADYNRTVNCYDDDARSSLSDASSRISSPSLYSQLTGVPRKTPDPKMPVKREKAELLPSRFSGSTFSSAERRKELEKKGIGLAKNPFWK